MQNRHCRQPYPSDLNAAQWRAISPLIPPERDRGRHRSTDVREIVDGINYRWSTGCVWRMLPHDFPPWGTVYTYFRRWQRDGTLKELRDELQASRRDSRQCNTVSPIVPPNDFAADDNRPVSDQYPVPAT